MTVSSKDFFGGVSVAGLLSLRNLFGDAGVQGGDSHDAILRALCSCELRCAIWLRLRVGIREKPSGRTWLDLLICISV